MHKPGKLRIGLAGLMAALLCAPVTDALGAEGPTSKNNKRLAQWLNRFPEADANKDGVLTLEEAQRHRQSRQRKGTGRQQAPTHANVKYGPHPRNVLDFYKAESAKPTPVLVFFHGGGFTGGNKQFTKLQKQCIPQGISAASANYRLTGPQGITIRESMHDGARVIQFLRTKAEEWNIDPDRIAVSGGSAGGCMSVWLATHDDLAEPESDEPVRRRSSRVLCACTSGAQTTLDPRVILEKIGGNRTIHPSVPAIFDVKSIRDAMDDPRALKLVREYSALKHVSKGDAPLYLSYGRKPPEGPYPEKTPIGESIHSAKFGQLIKEKYDELGLECILNYPEHRPEESPFEFLLRHFGMTDKEK